MRHKIQLRWDCWELFVYHYSSSYDYCGAILVYIHLQDMRSKWKFFLPFLISWNKRTCGWKHKTTLWKFPIFSGKKIKIPEMSVWNKTDVLNMDEEGNHRTLLFRSQIQTSACGRMIPTNNDVCEREHVCACVPDTNYTTTQPNTENKSLYYVVKNPPTRFRINHNDCKLLICISRYCAHSIINFGLLLMK